MKNTNQSFDELINKVVNWSTNRKDIRMALIVGSQSRIDHPADKWADMDIIFFTANPKPYLSHSEWISKIGNVWAQTRFYTVAKDAEWLVTFEGGLDVDFVFNAYSKMKWIMLLWLIEHFPRFKRLIPKQITHQLGLSAQVLERGVKVLIDKDHLSSRMQSIINEFKQDYQPPTQVEFTDSVQNFWLLAEKTAKKIGRGEFYVALSWCFGLQTIILRMLEWHAHAVSNDKHNIWHQGRFLEEWADRRALKEMSKTFPHYNKKEIREALFSMMNLYNWLTDETAKHFGFSYSVVADKEISAYIKKLLST